MLIHNKRLATLARTKGFTSTLSLRHTKREAKAIIGILPFPFGSLGRASGCALARTKGFSATLSLRHTKREAKASQCVAERKGFEPLDSFPSTVFKTAAFDRSAISPYYIQFCRERANAEHSSYRSTPCLPLCHLSIYKRLIYSNRQKDKCQQILVVCVRFFVFKLFIYLILHHRFKRKFRAYPVKLA